MAKRRNRFLLITQYFPPETGAPQARLFEFAQSLIARGWQVDVLTAMPNYPKGIIHDGYRGKWFMREQLDGINVIRTAIFPTKSASFLLRLSNYFSFVFSCVLLALPMVKRPAVIMVESPPLFLGLSGVFYKFAKRAPLIMNVSDLWPGTMVSMGMLKKGPLLSLAVALEKWLYRCATVVTGQSRGIISGVREKDRKVPVVHLPNGCDAERFLPDQGDEAFAEEHGFQDKTVVGYAGLIGLAQGIGIMVDLAERFREREDLVFVVVGDGPERETLEQRAKDADLTNIRFTGSVPKSRMPGILPLFHMAVIPLRYVIPGAVPSKIYETMAAGVPVILLAQGEPREIVTRAKGGVALDYEDLDGIATAIGQLSNQPEKRRQMALDGRAYVMEHHHRPRIAEKLDRLLRAMEAREKVDGDLPAEPRDAQ